MEKDFSNGLSFVLAGGADTIVACATPPGRSALAIVRLSGRRVAEVADAVCQIEEIPSGWKTRMVQVSDREGTPLESAVAITYSAPRSFTGEDMLELVVHGSSFIVREVVSSCVAAGARPAEPGEFTRRAVANGKMDLLQAEAVRDLIESETEWQARNARLQLGGALSAEVNGLREELVKVLALYEASLDFADDELAISSTELDGGVASCRELVALLLARAAAGERMREGVRIAIVGAPNAGKSTLFNTLIEEDKAIVSPQPGTTRDVVEGEMAVEGVRVVLRDTAGLREVCEPVEEEGVRRARAAMVDSRAVLLLWPAGASGASGPPTAPPGVSVIRVRSKADLCADRGGDDGWLPVSCVDGRGVEGLRSAIAALVLDGVDDLGGDVAISQRHRVALESAASDLEACGGNEVEVAVEHLRSAVGRIEELVGCVSDEDVLDRVFESFCIGK